MNDDAIAPSAREPIPISLVAHHEFCPRRAWLEAAGEHTDTAQMQIGTNSHRGADNVAASRSTEFRAVDVFDDDWGLTGRLDAVRIDGHSYTIREYKATPVRRSVEVTAPMRLQLALQAKCLRSMQGAEVATEIYFTSHNRVVQVELDEQDYRNAHEAVVQTRTCVTAPAAPEPLEDDARCTRCSHASVCLPDERQMRADARRITVSDPDAQIVHLTTPGSRAFTRSGQMRVVKGDEELAVVPLDLVQGVQVHGNVDLSSGLIRELLWRQVPVVWCSGTGRMYGWAQASYGPNGAARVQQHVASAQGRLGFAREFIAAKVANQATQLRRAAAVEPAVERLRAIQRLIGEAERWQDILGFEGEAASIYFGRWPMLLKERIRDEWDWSGRSGRPATDPVNALLNYGYSMLTSDAVKAVIACGLDPHAGFLHSSGRNKPALALDLIEEFRAPVVDSVVQTVINNGEVQPRQFSGTLGTWRMNDTARKSLVAAYERRMSTEFRHPIFGYSVTWRRALEVQARQVLGVLDGSQPTYRGIRVR